MHAGRCRPGSPHECLALRIAVFLLRLSFHPPDTTHLLPMNTPHTLRCLARRCVAAALLWLAASMQSPADPISLYFGRIDGTIRLDRGSSPSGEFNTFFDATIAQSIVMGNSPVGVTGRSPIKGDMYLSKCDSGSKLTYSPGYNQTAPIMPTFPPYIPCAFLA